MVLVLVLVLVLMLALMLALMLVLVLMLVVGNQDKQSMCDRQVPKSSHTSVVPVPMLVLLLRKCAVLLQLVGAVG
jgi:hypothetical protein